MKKKVTPRKKLNRNSAKSTNKIVFFFALAFGLFVSVLYVQHQQSFTQYAATGRTCTSTLSASDEAHMNSVIQGVMTTNNIPGLSVAITQNGRLVYAKGYGVTDKSTRAPVTKSTRFRIASISKPLTSTGIMLLVQSGRLSLDKKVFGPNSILGTKYTTTPKDPRINNITVRQLLSHTSGLWTNDANDPMFQNFSYSQSQLITWALNNLTLQSDPGTKYAYSNFGYLILGRVIEKVTGQSYATWMQYNVLRPSGIYDMQIAGSTLAQRASGEAVYYSQTQDPYSINVARMDAHGGWIATPTDLMRFAIRMDGFTPPSDMLSTTNEKLATTPSVQSLAAGESYGFGWVINPVTWWHSGTLPGTATVLVRKSSGFNWAVLTNSDDPPDNKVFFAIDAMMYDAMSGVKSWPTCNLF